MRLNDKNNVINDFINGNESIELELYLLRKTSNLEDKYQAKEMSLHEDLRKFLRSNLNMYLNDKKEENIFHVSQYNNELSPQNKLAYFAISEINTVQNNLRYMKQAMAKNSLEIRHTKFQLLKLIRMTDNMSCYIGYYQGMKKNTSNKKWAISFDTLKIVDENIIQMGGDFDFIIDESNYLYVNNPRAFEWAFNYSDHINDKRDKNINDIVTQGIFDNEDSIKIFKEEAEKYVRSRSMAQMSEETVKNLKSHFEDRCEDLKTIKEKIEENPSSTEKFKVDFGIIIDLLNFIDLENKKIKITDENKDDINNIFYLFQNKIVTSFLTREVKTALGYQN